MVFPRVQAVSATVDRPEPPTARVQRPATDLLRVLRGVEGNALRLLAIAPGATALLHEMRQGLDASTGHPGCCDPFISVKGG